MKTIGDETIETYMAFFAMFIAVVNIVIVLLNSPQVFLKPFSISLSILIFYFGWKIISELEVYQRIKTLVFLHHLEREAVKEARRVIKNVNNSEQKS